jgi:3-phenylpropionate/cinnamic acid dioxygenase small subunit
MATLQELKDRLTQLNTAIDYIEQGHQSYTNGDATYTHADIGKYYDQREKLERRIARLNGSRPMTLTVNMSAAAEG